MNSEFISPSSSTHPILAPPAFPPSSNRVYKARKTWDSISPLSCSRSTVRFRRSGQLGDVFIWIHLLFLLRLLFQYAINVSVCGDSKDVEIDVLWCWIRLGFSKVLFFLTFWLCWLMCFWFLKLWVLMVLWFYLRISWRWFLWFENGIRF